MTPNRLGMAFAMQYTSSAKFGCNLAKGTRNICLSRGDVRLPIQGALMAARSLALYDAYAASLTHGGSVYACWIPHLALIRLPSGHIMEWRVECRYAYTHSACQLPINRRRAASATAGQPS
jgi:hypothetical protein